jgi:hypothetical protein
MTIMLVAQDGAGNPAVIILEKANGFGVFDQLDVTGRANGSCQSAHNGFAGEVTSHPRDTGLGVGSLKAQRKLSIGGAIKRDAKLNQVADPRWALFGNQARDHWIDQASACGNRIGCVLLRAVFWMQRRRQSALCPG